MGWPPTGARAVPPLEWATDARLRWGRRRGAVGGLAATLQSSGMAILEAFPNPHPQRDYLITHTCPEFTAVCPKTGQPDFGTIVVAYVPDRLCVELKSLKLYLFGYRDRGIYYEDVVNAILNDLVALLGPRRMSVEGQFHVRGGISSVVRAEHAAPPAKRGAARRRSAGGGRRS